MNNEEYLSLLLKQVNNSTKPGINYYLRWMYAKIEKNLVGNKILEIGSGPGLSAKFIKKENVTLTDLLYWSNSNVKGNIDATNLPFETNSFDSAFAVDAIHHVSYPVKSIIELCRVVRPGGTITIIEPYVSYFSFLVYKFFHNESTIWNYKIPNSGKTVSEIASEGEQSTLQALISNKLLISEILLRIDKDITLSINYFSPISFFATGGLSNPLPISKNLIKLLIKLEQLLPSRILKFISARQILFIDIK
jgi:SAM-dependent methyltransferase